MFPHDDNDAEAAEVRHDEPRITLRIRIFPTPLFDEYELLGFELMKLRSEPRTGTALLFEESIFLLLPMLYTLLFMISTPCLF